MKSLYIAGSRKFFDDIEKLAELCVGNDIKVSTPKKGFDDAGFEGEKEALFRAFELIDIAEVVFVFAKGGYVGKTVAMEISYAYARNKEIISLEEIEEFSARAIVNKVMNAEELIEYVKDVEGFK